MNSLIIGILFYFGWMLIKNVLKETNTSRESTGKYKTPPIINKPQFPFFEFENDKQIELEEDNKTIYKQFQDNTFELDIQEKPSEKNKDFVEVQNRKFFHQKDDNIDENIVKSSQKNINVNNQNQSTVAINFTQQSVLNGVIMAEILGPPKSKK